jgi:N-dimethylarginine dimethylaminohydrolase
MRVFGFILVIGCGIASVVTFIAPVEAYLNWLSIIGVVAGSIIIHATRKIPLEEGETLIYKGAANVGEGGLLKSKAGSKIVVTNKGVKIGNFYKLDDQINLPFATIKDVQPEGSLFIRINAENTSVKLQFGIGQKNKFLTALAQCGVKIIGGIDV